MALPAHIRNLVRFFETLAIAVAGGLLFVWIGFPAGLISGSTLAVSLAAVLGRPMFVPLALARVGYVLLGILLGTVVTPETLQGLATYPLSIAVLAVATVAMTVATSAYLQYVHRWDALSALFGASPGSMAQVMVLTVEYGSDLRAVAIVQTTRVLLLTVGMPLGLALFGLAASPAGVPAATFDASPGELALLGAVSALTALLMLWLRFPGGLLFGAMAGSGVLHGTGLVQATLPWWVTAAAVVVLGAVIGTRFANTSARVLLGYAGAAFGSFAVSIAVAACFAIAVAGLLSVSVADVVVAFAPGAQDTMMVLALALHLDPVYVGAHHLSRYLVVTFMVAIFARRIGRRLPSPREEASRKRRGSGTFDD